MIGCVGGDATGPARDVGKASAAFPARPFEAGHAVVAVEDVAALFGCVSGGDVVIADAVEALSFDGAALLCGVDFVAVVRAKEDDGVVGNAERVEFIEDDANGVVEAEDHGCVFFFKVGEFWRVFYARMNFGDGDGSVGQLRGVEEEEGLVAMFAEEIDDFVVEKVLGVGDFPGHVVADGRVFRRF